MNDDELEKLREECSELRAALAEAKSEVERLNARVPEQCECTGCGCCSTTNTCKLCGHRGAVWTP